MEELKFGEFEVNDYMLEEINAMGSGDLEAEDEPKRFSLAAAVMARIKNTPFAKKAIWNNNYWLRSPHKIDKVCPHIMCAVKWTADTCGNYFARVKVSSNYGIGYKGDTDQYVEEKYGAWAQGSKKWNQRVASIEMANSTGAPDWKVSDETLDACIELIADIMIRNKLGKANYTGDISGNLIEHNMTASTSCPGPYVHKKMPHIESEVNKIIKGDMRLHERGYFIKGDYGRSVRTLKQWLKKKGFYKGISLNRTYSTATVKAVKRFQEKYGLTVDGEWGKECMTQYKKLAK